MFTSLGLLLKGSVKYEKIYKSENCILCGNIFVLTA